MDRAQPFASDLAFTPTVTQVQARKGSRRACERMEQDGSWETTVTPELAQFIGAQTSVFLATANAAGPPYIQHRGGPPVFRGCSTGAPLVLPTARLRQLEGAPA